ncbi:CGNR zinc finger domain-containing protein [Lentibacillus halophilus]|uniref:CGNR zinc finger domain-containing protein n=1 Tax=Lentibacillus halophilus TaxID=295065 RepID=A0ABP3IZ12_9BACI
MAERNIFPLLSNHLSLNLVNTEVVKNKTRHDLLHGHFAHWIETMHQSQILMEEQYDKEQVITDGLDTLLDLRAFLRDGFESIADGHPPGEQWLSQLESIIEKTPLTFKRITDKLVPIPVTTSVDAIVSLAALDALQLYTTGDLQTLHRCVNPDCVLLFMDKSGRRKWCSMKICGNRSKVSRHQHRHSHQ